jgi:hypothetical protein
MVNDGKRIRSALVADYRDTDVRRMYMFVSCAPLVSYHLGRRPGTAELPGPAVYLGSFHPSRKTSQEEADWGHFSV